MQPHPPHLERRHAHSGAWRGNSHREHEALAVLPEPVERGLGSGAVAGIERGHQPVDTLAAGDRAQRARAQAHLVRARTPAIGRRRRGVEDGFGLGNRRGKPGALGLKHGDAPAAALHDQEDRYDRHSGDKGRRDDRGRGIGGIGRQRHQGDHPGKP